MLQHCPMQKRVRPSGVSEEGIPIVAANEGRRSGETRTFEEIQPRLLICADRVAGERCAGLVDPGKIPPTTNRFQGAPTGAGCDGAIGRKVGERPCRRVGRFQRRAVDEGADALFGVAHRGIPIGSVGDIGVEPRISVRLDPGPFG